MKNEQTKDEIKALIKKQFQISRLTTNSELTLAIPKIDGITIDEIKLFIEEEEEGSKPEIIFFQEFCRPNTNNIMLITLKKS